KDFIPHPSHSVRQFFSRFIQIDAQLSKIRRLRLILLVLALLARLSLLFLRLLARLSLPFLRLLARLSLPFLRLLARLSLLFLRLLARLSLLRNTDRILFIGRIFKLGQIIQEFLRRHFDFAPGGHLFFGQSFMLFLAAPFFLPLFHLFLKSALRGFEPDAKR